MLFRSIYSRTIYAIYVIPHRQYLIAQNQPMEEVRWEATISYGNRRRETQSGMTPVAEQAKHASSTILLKSHSLCQLT